MINLKHSIYYVAICFVVLMLYFPSLQNNYGFNDNYIFNKVTEKGISAFAEIFTSPYRVDENLSYGYRPVTSLSVAVETSLFGKNAAISHAINIVLYALICCLLFRILIVFFPTLNKRYCLVACLTFAVLSIHTDVVCNIKSRDELLCAFFAFTAALFCKKYINLGNIIYVIIALLLFLLADLSKPTDIVYLALITILLLYVYTHKNKSVLVSFLFLLSGSLIARLLRFAFGDTVNDHPFIQFPLQDASVFERIIAAICSVGKYIELVFCPVNLSFYYGYKQIPISISEALSNVSFYVGLIGLPLLIIGVIYFFKKNKLISLGFAFLLAGFFFFSNLFLPAPGLVAERFFFAPSMAVVFLVVGVLQNYKNLNIPKGIKLTGTSLFLLLFIYQTQKTFYRNYAWKDKITLFKTDISHLQKSAKANMLYADEMMHLNRKNDNKKYKFKDIEKHYLQVIDIYPLYSTAFNNYAFACLYFGYDDKAKNYIDKTLDMERSAQSLFNLSVYYQKKGKINKEITILKEIIIQNEANSVSQSAFSRLHHILIEKKQYDEGLKYANKAVKLFPNNSHSYDHIAKCHFALTNYEEAFKNWKVALQKNPQSKVITYKLFKAYEQVNEPDSLALYRKKFELIE